MQLKTFLKSEDSAKPFLFLSNLLKTKSIQACLSSFVLPLIAIKKSSIFIFFSFVASNRLKSAHDSSLVK